MDEKYFDTLTRYQFIHSISFRIFRLVLCLGCTTPYREVDNVDGEPVVFERKIFPKHTTLKVLREVQNMMGKDHIQSEGFKDRIIFTSMHNDIDWSQKGKEESRKRNFPDVAEYAKKFPR